MTSLERADFFSFWTVPIPIVMLCQTLVIFIGRYFVQNKRATPFFQWTSPFFQWTTSMGHHFSSVPTLKIKVVRYTSNLGEVLCYCLLFLWLWGEKSIILINIYWGRGVKVLGFTWISIWVFLTLFIMITIVTIRSLSKIPYGASVTHPVPALLYHRGLRNSCGKSKLRDV